MTPRERRFLADFVTACEQRDAAALERLLTRRAVLTIDSGGVVAIASHAEGRAAVARLLLELIERFPRVRLESGHINGRPGLVLVSWGRVVGILHAAHRRSAARELWIVVNPEKLRHWNRD
jgi:RNA polymerase sigma-70 factor (ECF subfamily)